MKKILGIMAVFGGAQLCFGSLILQSLVPLSGTGLGAESTLLTIQSAGSGSTEIGCVGNSASQIGSNLSPSGVCSGSSGDVKTGNGQIGPQTLGSVGLSTGAAGAAAFSIIFNAAEPSGDAITLNSLTVAIYSSTGQFIWESGAVSCTAAGLTGCNFPTTIQGTGGAGYLFKLDSTQQAAAVSAGAFSNVNNIVGLQASASNATGGQETFFLSNVAGTQPPPTVVPEPGTMVTGLVGVALAALGWPRRKRLAADL